MPLPRKSSSVMRPKPWMLFLALPTAHHTRSLFNACHARWQRATLHRRTRRASRRGSIFLYEVGTMNKSTLISEMLKFHFGSKIFCFDGDDGVLVEVIIDPSTRNITHVGVKQGRLFGKTVHLPFNDVVSATGDGVTLSVKLAD